MRAGVGAGRNIRFVAVASRPWEGNCFETSEVAKIIHKAERVYSLPYPDSFKHLSDLVTFDQSHSLIFAGPRRERQRFRA